MPIGTTGLIFGSGYQTFYIVNDNAGLTSVKIGSSYVSLGISSPPSFSTQLQCAASYNDIIYLAFGYDGSIDYGNLFSYNPKSKNTVWTALASAPALREQPGFVATNGYLYAICGNTTTSVSTNSVFEYNISANSWATKGTAPVSNGTAGYCANNGIIYMCGGFTQPATSNKFFYQYNPASDTWLQLTDHPNANGISYIGLVGAGKYIYAIGGKDGSTGNSVTAVNRFEIATNTWTTLSSLLVAKDAFACGLVNDKIYVAGGNTNAVASTTTHVYNVGNDSWSPDTALLGNISASGLGMGIVATESVGRGGA